MKLLDIATDNCLAAFAGTLDERIGFGMILVLEFVVNGNFVSKITATGVVDRYRLAKPVVPDKIYALI